MDIHAAIDEYLTSKQNSITKKTHDWYTMFLVLFAKWCDEHHITKLTQITASTVQQFVSDCPTSNSNTRHHRAQVVKGFLNWCAQDEDFGVREKMVRRIEMPKQEQPDVDLFTEADINKLMNACERTPHPHRNRAILHILLDTGIRASECCFDGERPQEETGLRMENLILVRGNDSYIRVMGKGRKARTIGIGNETSLAMRRYLNRERSHSDCPYVFLGRTGAPLSLRMLEHLLGELGDMAGVPDCYPHRFRHTFAVNQLLNGTSSLVLMQLLGHSTLESTKIYIRAMTQIQARKAATSVVDTMRSHKRGGKR